jgi:alcohol dehydrogenase
MDIRIPPDLWTHRANIRWQLAEERLHLIPPHLLAQNRTARAVSPMHLKHILRQVEPDSGNLRHDRSPLLILADPPWDIDAVGGAVTSSEPRRVAGFCSAVDIQPVRPSNKRGIALKAMPFVNDYLPHAFADGTDLEAGAQVMAAAAFHNGLGAILALSQPVGAIYNTHHGTTNAVVMLACLRFNRSAIGGKIGAVAAYRGIAGGFDGFAVPVAELNAAFGFAKGLGAMGVEASRIDGLAAMAIEDPNAGGNPVAMTLDNTRALFADAM